MDGERKDGTEVFMRMRRTGQLRTMMRAYCDRRGEYMIGYVFLFDGLRIRPSQTPDELELEDGDEIDAFLHQLSGFAPL
ncbi:PREDICTED: small ubiquitin-related modifier 1-like [Tarenaya hassleriana]|uniref:small ubiquitin-related modifier 1-like n=1 Tax=Tarenaya hassleriana TaxID=28532 RepID=UPI0008FD022D|nr:PREDICTED: small ubiquitin-related modifier 1-like [Tarenaya hassleriana]